MDTILSRLFASFPWSLFSHSHRHLSSLSVTCTPRSAPTNAYGTRSPCGPPAGHIPQRLRRQAGNHRSSLTGNLRRILRTRVSFSDPPHQLQVRGLLLWEAPWVAGEMLRDHSLARCNRFSWQDRC